MVDKLNLDEFKQALCDVRKAHRLIYAYQSKMLDLTNYIKTKLGFDEYSGRNLFSYPIGKKQKCYADLNIENIWAFNFLNTYVFEYYFGKKNELQMSVLQVSDTGCFDNNAYDDTSTNIDKFECEEKSITKLIFVIEKRVKTKKSAWESLMIHNELFENQKIMSASHKMDCLNLKGSIQIIYSFPLERFLNEETTIEVLKEFVTYCNDKGIAELKLVDIA